MRRRHVSMCVFEDELNRNTQLCHKLVSQALSPDCLTRVMRLRHGAFPLQ